MGGTIIDIGGGTKLYIDNSNRKPPKDWEWIVAYVLIGVAVLGVIIGLLLVL